MLLTFLEKIKSSQFDLLNDIVVLYVFNNLKPIYSRCVILINSITLY